MRKNIKYTRSRKEKLLVLIPFFILILSFILYLSGNSKAEFWANIIIGTFFIIFALIIGLYSLLSKNKGYKLSTIIRIKVIGAAVLLFSIFLTKQFIIFYEDIPAAISSNYSYFNGKLVNFYVSHGKSTSTYVTIENEKFKINGDISKKGYLVNGDTYGVEFLPNSKYVIALYRYENSSKIIQ